MFAIMSGAWENISRRQIVQLYNAFATPLVLLISPHRIQRCVLARRRLALVRLDPTISQVSLASASHIRPTSDPTQM